MFGVTRAIVYVWTKRGRYGFVLTSRRELRQERSSVSFRVLDVQSFAWQQNLKLDYSVLHPLLLARLKIKLDDNGVALDNDARVVE